MENGEWKMSVEILADFFDEYRVSQRNNASYRV